MGLNFEKFAADGNKFVEDLARKLGYPNDTARSGRVLRAVLHALRNQLTVEESIQLLAQLPMFMKAVYVDQWSTHEHEKARTMDDLFEEVRRLDKQTAMNDFPNDEHIDVAIDMVIYVLRKYISLGELEDIKAVLPKELKAVVNPALMI